MSSQSFENIGRILNKVRKKSDAEKFKAAEDQFEQLTKAVQEYNKQGGIPGEFHDAHHFHHLFKDLAELIQEGKSRYDHAEQEFQTMVYFYSCVNKNKRERTIPTKIEDTKRPHNGIDKLIDWAHKKNLPIADTAEKEAVHLRDISLQWDDLVRTTPFLGKLPPVSPDATSTKELDALFEQAAKDQNLKNELESARHEIDRLRHNSNQYVVTVIGLQKEDNEGKSPEPRKRRLSRQDSVDAPKGLSRRQGVQGSLRAKRKLEKGQSFEHATGDMITISKDRMRRMEQKEELYKAQIEDLTTRLSSLASRQLTDANPNIADLSDKNRPTKIAEKFGELYDEEWADAYEDLSDKLQYDEDKILQILQRIVMMAFTFCHDMSETQVKELESQMEHCMTMMTCICSNKTYQVDRPDTNAMRHFSSVNKLAREWRKSAALASVPSLCVIFKEHKMKESGEFNWNPHEMPNLNIYIDKCIELTWLMAVQQPKMHLTESSPGEPMDKAVYRYYHQKGDIVRMTVWPALFLYQGGPIVSKGFVYPDKY